MLVTETVARSQEVYVAPCIKCGSNDISIDDDNQTTFNSGGGTCRACNNKAYAACEWAPAKKFLINTWNKANDVADLIDEKHKALNDAQATINELLFKPGMQHKIYLAGPDVFRQDAIERGEYLKSLCAEQGMKGMYPFDNAIPEGLQGPEAAKVISQMNMDMIRNCTGVLINLDHFRGLEPDSGTAFEFGMAVALGKPVWAYCKDQGTLRDQIVHNSAGVCQSGFHVEDFGLPRNLMMACTWMGLSATAEEAVESFSKALAVVAQ